MTYNCNRERKWMEEPQDNQDWHWWVGIFVHPPTWVGRGLEHSLLTAPTTADLQPSLDIIWKHLTKPIYSSFNTPHFSPKLEITQQTFFSPVLGLSLLCQLSQSREMGWVVVVERRKASPHSLPPISPPLAVHPWLLHCGLGVALFMGWAHHFEVWENRRTFVCFKEPFQRKRQEEIGI